ncbi:glycoside hydrolase family 3 N-terminal domain-containing protein [Clostridium sp.]|uniref:glycoside hydrolase family 3 protein n=1 Tax=Clostridium sp. TaxID=1506 RepID=UPI003216CD79
MKSSRNIFTIISKLIKFIIIVVVICTSVILFCGCRLINREVKDNNEIDVEGKSEDDLGKNNSVEELGEEEPQVDLIQNEIDAMSLEEKVGQMFIVGFDGYDVDDNIINLIKSKKVGGIILFSKNINTVNQTKKLIGSLNELNSKNKFKLFISVDEEGGIVSRIPKEIGQFESAWDVGVTGDLNYAFEHGKAIGETIKSLGFNLDFAPVLDVNSNPNNPVIGIRAFSDDPEIVKKMGTEVYKGLRSTGILGVGKHFPGHGDTNVDSHVGVPVINKSIEELKNLELIPFKYAIDNGLDMIMVSHLYLPQLDKTYVASVSKNIVTKLLREDLGFNGVIVTDDMIMEGVKGKYPTNESAVKAIEAGDDLIIVSAGIHDQNSAIDGVMEAVRNGIISEKRINESVYRILKIKNDL